MYAVVRTGSKQFRVSKDDVIIVEKLDVESGGDVELEEVLVLDDGKKTILGTPLVEGVHVAATVLDQTRGEKVTIFKKKRRKGYKRSKGHRQQVTVLRVTDIVNGAKKKATKAKAMTDESKTVAQTSSVKTASEKKKTTAKKTTAKKTTAKETGTKVSAEGKTTSKKASSPKNSSKKPKESN